MAHHVHHCVALLFGISGPLRAIHAEPKWKRKQKITLRAYSHWAKKIREQVKFLSNIKDNFHFRSVWRFVNLGWLNHFSPMFRANLFGNSSKNWHPLDYGAECHISNAIKLAVKTIKCNHANFCIQFRIALKSMRSQCHGQRKSITPGKFVLVQFYFEIFYF